jgi:hypothetical protein
MLMAPVPLSKKKNKKKRHQSHTPIGLGSLSNQFTRYDRVAQQFFIIFL